MVCKILALYRNEASASLRLSSVSKSRLPSSNDFSNNFIFTFLLVTSTLRRKLRSLRDGFSLIPKKLILRVWLKDSCLAGTVKVVGYLHLRNICFSCCLRYFIHLTLSYDECTSCSRMSIFLFSRSTDSAFLTYCLMYPVRTPLYSYICTGLLSIYRIFAYNARFLYSIPFNRSSSY